MRHWSRIVVTAKRATCSSHEIRSPTRTVVCSGQLERSGTRRGSGSRVARILSNSTVTTVGLDPNSPNVTAKTAVQESQRVEITFSRSQAMHKPKHGILLAVFAGLLTVAPARQRPAAPGT
jgi:hypothetical protein